MKKDKILAEVLQHNCTNCSDFVSVFVSVDIPKTDKQRQKESRHRQKTKILNIETQFPPKPASHSNVESIIAGFAKDVQVANFLESGCAVCGLLTSGTQLQKLDCAEFDRDLLLARGLVTRQERFSVNDPVIEIPGPVLLPHCNDICTSCLKELQNGKLPVDSLANGLWIGEVPPALQGLSWTEKMIISRVKHNMCIVKVHMSGMSKMKANVVSHSLPMPKIY
ncbi:hypothetical protein C8Q76DRAFT_634118, partial [Earliella scabrosa]